MKEAHAHTHTHTNTHAYAHTHTLSLSLSPHRSCRIRRPLHHSQGLTPPHVIPATNNHSTALQPIKKRAKTLRNHAQMLLEIFERGMTLLAYMVTFLSSPPHAMKRMKKKGGGRGGAA
jgi:hypothetical protein